MPCTTILVGKKASYDGSTIIARNDDGGFDTKKVVIVDKYNNLFKKDNKYKSVISHLEIELPETGFMYSAIPNINTKNGFWAACGINEVNVGMTATETITTNPRVLAADPLVYYEKEEKNEQGEVIKPEKKGGIGEEDLLILTLPYILCAKDGVKRVGELLEKYGTYESNGMAFSDKDNIWWLESIGGHHWIACRVPDDKVVIMPNQFGLDNFDFEDAYGKQENYMCSKDLKEFIENNNLDLNNDGSFNPRLAFGSHDDIDHLYNTARAWYIGRYFCPRTYVWDGELAEYNTESNDIPWSLVPEAKVTIEDIRYVLSSYYQGTPYNPYLKGEKAGKYRTIGVPNTDDCGIIQIRGYKNKALQGVEWLNLGGANFTCSFPIYTNVDKLPEYISATPSRVDTNYMYWQSRIFAALVDAQYAINIATAQNYQNTVSVKSRELLFEYDKKFEKNNDIKILEEANNKICEMVKKETDKYLEIVLKAANNSMKTRFHRSDY